MTTCKNCNTEFEGKFCSECGQKAKTGRITIKQIFKDLRDHFIHFDQGFLFTIKELTLRPGHTVREYIDGKRVKHIKPLRFMFWATAISLLVVNFFGFSEKLIAEIETNKEIGATAQKNHAGVKMVHFLTEHPSVMTLMLIPFIALSAMLFYRKQRLNYAEHFSAAAYFMGQLSFLSIFTSVSFMSTQHLNLTVAAIAGSLQWIAWMIYCGWAYSQFARQSNKWQAWIKGALSLIMGYLLMIIAMSMIVATLIYCFPGYFRSIIEGICLTPMLWSVR